MLDIWLTLPIDLRVYDHRALNEDNVIAALEHKDRICGVYIQNSDKDLFESLMVFSVQYLSLWLEYFPSPAVPDSFLGRSA